MTTEIRLEHFLASRAQRGSIHEDLASILLVIASTGARIARIIARRGLRDQESMMTVMTAASEARHPLERLSHNIFTEALGKLPISFVTSEKSDEIIELDPNAPLGIAIDPLDGCLNIETNGSIGSVFSVLAANASTVFDKKFDDIRRASGFLLYGPQTRLVLTCGDGTYSFLLDPDDGNFYQVGDAMTIPDGQREFAINTANYRFWDDSVRYFIDDCIAGVNGPLGEDFNMRWNGSLVAEAFRILTRGGIFLYPGDSRPGYGSGRLRLLFDALPLAYVVEQAGGQASDGSDRILDMKLASLQSRVPLIFGSSDRVGEVIDYMTGDAVENTRFPLFENRSLFRN